MNQSAPASPAMRTEASVSSSLLSPPAVARPGLTVPRSLLLLLASLLVYSVARRALFHSMRVSESAAFAMVVLAWVFGLVMAQIRYRDFAPVLRPFVRGIGMIVLAQVLFDNFIPIPGVPNLAFGTGEHALFFRGAAALAVAAGVLALWRPGFLLPVFFYYVGFRVLIGSVDGIPVVDTDYLSMLDTVEFALIGGCLIAWLTGAQGRRYLPWLKLDSEGQDIEQVRRHAFGLVWACAVGAHLGNYFMSGLAKLAAGGDAPLTWLLHNATNTSIVIGLERGDNPLATMPWAVQMLWNGIQDHLLLFNGFVLGVQLLSPLAPLGIGSLIVFTLLFDMFHLGVYMTLGALFFFWIAVNTVIWISARRLQPGEFTPTMKAVAVLTVLFGHYAFYTNHLGWLDGAKLASPTFFAETRDGRKVMVPGNFFGISSYTIAQGGMYIPDDNFSFRIGGNNLDVASWRDAASCGPAVQAHQDTGVSLGAVESLVRNTDRMMREYPILKDWNLFYLYPHHMVPNPLVFRPFDGLAMSDIVGYRYEVDSVCLTVQDGKLQRDVRKHWEHRIDVR
jgi:hypothetical protein